jgi:hypothetical protein
MHGDGLDGTPLNVAVLRDVSQLHRLLAWRQVEGDAPVAADAKPVISDVDFVPSVWIPAGGPHYHPDEPKLRFSRSIAAARNSGDQW